MDPKRQCLHTRNCILALLNSLTVTIPWSDWQIVASHTNVEINDHCTTPLIYVDAPVMTESKEYFGSLPVNGMRMTIGVWNGPKSGGMDEHAIILDELYHLFSGSNVYHYEFDVKLRGVQFTDTSLYIQGIRIDSVGSPVSKDAPSSAALHSQIHLELSL